MANWTDHREQTGASQPPVDLLGECMASRGPTSAGHGYARDMPSQASRRRGANRIVGLVRGPRSSVALRCLTVAVVLGLAVRAFSTSWPARIPLDALWLLPGAPAVAVILLAITLARRGRQWWSRVVPTALAITVGIVAVLTWWLRASGTVKDAYPASFTVWVGVAVFTIMLAVLGSRGATFTQRSAGWIAVPATVVAAFLLINSHYGYWPTLGDLIGHPSVTSISAGQLRQQLTNRNQLTSARTRDQRSPRVARRGELVSSDIPADVSGFVHRPASVYLPPAYFSGERNLPVLVMLGGTPSDATTWATAGHAVATADQYAAQHNGYGPVMLFVDANGSWYGDTECVDGPRGRAETYLAIDVPRYATRELHLSANPDLWGLIGFSEGGTCAIDIALRHPSSYHHFVDVAGDAAPNVTGNTTRNLYGGSDYQAIVHQPSWLLAHQRYPALTAWFVSGSADHPHRRIDQRLQGEAARAGIQTSLIVEAGGHNWPVCSNALKRILPDLLAQFPTPTGRPNNRHRHLLQPVHLTGNHPA